MIKDFISVNVEGIQEAIKEAVAEALGNNVQIAKTEEKQTKTLSVNGNYWISVCNNRSSIALTLRIRLWSGQISNVC